MVDADERSLKFGGYALLELLGSGGMGDVFKAATVGPPSSLRRQVAIKCLQPGLVSSPAIVEMFLAEARICASLDHPNIVKVEDFGRINGRFFLTMEYLDGRNLRAVLAQLHAANEFLPVPCAVFIATAVADALAHAHSRTREDGTPMGLVHRDVTPSNIMLLRSGGVKLLDFGVASVHGSADGAPLKGKLAYLAPECLDGRPDHRSDIYSLGVVLWESLISRSLFRGNSPAETLHNLQKRVVPPPSHFRPEIPAALDQMVLRALARDPERRYQTALDLACALQSFLEAQGFEEASSGGLFEELVNHQPADPQSSSTLALPPPDGAASSAVTVPLPPPASPPPSGWRAIPRRAIAYGLLSTALLVGAWQIPWSSSGRRVVSPATPVRPLIYHLPATPVGAGEGAQRSESSAGSPRRGRKPTRARRVELTLDPFAQGERPTDRPEGLW
jgi:serine/threonine-protein kinase